MLRDHKLYAENQGYFLGVLAVLAFSLTLPITKYLTPFLSVWDIGFGRQGANYGYYLLWQVVFRLAFLYSPLLACSLYPQAMAVSYWAAYRL